MSAYKLSRGTLWVLQEPRGRSRPLYPEGRRYELSFKNQAVRWGRTKASFWTDRPQNRDTRNTTLFKRFARFGLGTYMNEQQDEDWWAWDQSKKYAEAMLKSLRYGKPFKTSSREVTSDLCFRRLILAALKMTTQKQKGGLCGVYLNTPGWRFSTTESTNQVISGSIESHFWLLH